MTSDQKDAAASVLISQKFSKGQTIVNEGDPASSFYIIKEVKKFSPAFQHKQGNSTNSERRERVKKNGSR